MDKRSLCWPTLILHKYISEECYTMRGCLAHCHAPIRSMDAIGQNQWRQACNKQWRMIFFFFWDRRLKSFTLFYSILLLTVTIWSPFLRLGRYWSSSLCLPLFLCMLPQKFGGQISDTGVRESILFVVDSCRIKEHDSLQKDVRLVIHFRKIFDVEGETFCSLLILVRLRNMNLRNILDSWFTSKIFYLDFGV